MKRSPILIVQTGIVAEWITLSGIQGSAVAMLGSARSSGKVVVSSDHLVGAKYKEQLEFGSRGVCDGPLTSQQEHFPLLLVRRLRQCCLVAIRLLDQWIRAWPALGQISILVWNELVLSGKLKLTFKRRSFDPCHCLRRDLMHGLMVWLFSYHSH